MGKSDSESESLITTGAFEVFRSLVMTEVDGLVDFNSWEWEHDGLVFVDGTTGVRELDWIVGKASSM